MLREFARLLEERTRILWLVDLHSGGVWLASVRREHALRIEQIHCDRIDFRTSRGTSFAWAARLLSIWTRAPEAFRASRIAGEIAPQPGEFSPNAWRGVIRRATTFRPSCPRGAPIGARGQSIHRAKPRPLEFAMSLDPDLQGNWPQSWTGQACSPSLIHVERC